MFDFKAGARARAGWCVTTTTCAILGSASVTKPVNDLRVRYWRHDETKAQTETTAGRESECIRCVAARH